MDVVARRTSPTNMGLALLTNLTAYDFGYTTMDELLERCRNTLETMTRLSGIEVIYTIGTVLKHWNLCSQDIYHP